MSVKYKINTCFQGPNGNKYYTEEKEFNDDKHFENYCAAIIRNGKVKLIGTERVYSQAKEFTMNDIKEAFLAGKFQKYESFDKWFNLYFKREIL